MISASPSPKPNPSQPSPKVKSKVGNFLDTGLSQVTTVLAIPGLKKELCVENKCRLGEISVVMC